jgi:hypothetical protein
MRAHGWTRRRRLGIALVGPLLGTIAGGVPAASAASIAYIDGNEVWVSTLDGSRKERLSGGENQWEAVAAADNGRIIAARIEAGKISQLAGIQLWENNGQVISQGPLPSKLGWTSYVAPLSLDLTSDGVFAVYGYSGQTGFYPTATFDRGHYAILADTKTNGEPIGQSGYTWPTTFGRRVIAGNGGLVSVQAADTSSPFSTTWSTLLDTAPTGLNLHRADVAANGRLVGLDLSDSTLTTEKIAVVAINGIDTPATFPAAVDCFIPAAGAASDVTFSQDGTLMAWKDDQGVKVAGVPTTTADPCAFSSPPVVISPTGSSPSIGGADVSQLRPAAPAGPGTTAGPGAGAGPGGGGSGGGGSGGSGSGGALSVGTVPTKGSATALGAATGLTLKLTVPAPGKVTVTATVAPKALHLKGKKAIVVATGSATATKAGKLSLHLKLTRTGRKYRKRLKGATITLKITQGKKTTTKRVKLG